MTSTRSSPSSARTSPIRYNGQPMQCSCVCLLVFSRLDERFADSSEILE
jgi:hypothetical protein